MNILHSIAHHFSLVYKNLKKVGDFLEKYTKDELIRFINKNIQDLHSFLGVKPYALFRCALGNPPLKKIALP